LEHQYDVSGEQLKPDRRGLPAGPDGGLHPLHKHPTYLTPVLPQVVRKGLTITLSALIDGKNFNQGGHKVGLSVEVEP